jgi:hypothetical protein
MLNAKNLGYDPIQSIWIIAKVLDQGARSAEFGCQYQPDKNLMQRAL